jgi:hypothetical protein
MSKIIRHKWIPQDGFRSDKCEHCNCVRKWDDDWKRVVYYVDGKYLKLFTPACKRVGHCDLITKN